MRFMQTSKLFTLLPEELVCTPDGMAIDRDGNLILSCPNFADLSMPSCVLKIDKDRNIKKWFDVPRNEYTGEARAMGIEFGPDGDLYLVDNAGWTGEPHMVFTGRILRLRLNDAGVVHKITFNPDGSVKENRKWACDPANLKSTDGMTIDPYGNIYVADFSANAIARITPDGRVTRMACSPDTDGFHGELDEPGEPCVWGDKIIVSCFDLVTDEEKVNTAHEMPATMAMLDVEP